MMHMDEFTWSINDLPWYQIPILVGAFWLLVLFLFLHVTAFVGFPALARAYRRETSKPISNPKKYMLLLVLGVGLALILKVALGSPILMAVLLSFGSVFLVNLCAQLGIDLFKRIKGK